MKSIRVILDAIVEAVQNGLGQRDSRRIARGQADLKSATAAVAAATGADMVVPEIDTTDSDDSDEIVIPKAAIRKKIAAPKDDEADVDTAAE